MLLPSESVSDNNAIVDVKPPLSFGFVPSNTPTIITESAFTSVLEIASSSLAAEIRLYEEVNFAFSPSVVMAPFKIFPTNLASELITVTSLMIVLFAITPLAPE